MEPFKLYSAVYLILIKDNNILLLRRKNTGFEDGNYSLPSGHLNGNETIVEATIRETLEETGITLKPGNLEVVQTMHRISPDREYVDFFLIADEWQGEPSNKEPDKCDDLSWFPLNNLPSNIIPYVRFAVENYKAVKFSEFGR
jgi:ADP-ribose pyrophosphatase YjhB (NUDIX family)